MTGAQFEIRIDGTPRTYRDRKDFAMEAARYPRDRFRICNQWLLTEWSAHEDCTCESWRAEGDQPKQASRYDLRRAWRSK